MRQFATLLLAAILGSTATFFAIRWVEGPNSNVRIEHVNGAPVSTIGYTRDASGALVPLDFTQVADKVTKAVVHIKSTSAGRTVQRSKIGRAHV